MSLLSLGGNLIAQGGFAQQQGTFTSTAGYSTTTSYPSTLRTWINTPILSGTNNSITFTPTLTPRNTMSGKKLLVVCPCQNSVVYPQEVKDMEEAEALATQLAHEYQCDVFILKPVKQVSPKREVTVKDLK